MTWKMGVNCAVVALCLLGASTLAVDGQERRGHRDTREHVSRPHAHPGWQGRRYSRYKNEWGTAVIGGVIGGVIGNWFRPAPPPVVVVKPGPQPWSPEWMDYCQDTYRTFDAKTGFYTGYDGQPHFCRVN